MKIDFNKVLAAAMPDVAEVELDGKAYRIKDPALLDVAALDAVRVREKEESEEAHGRRILDFLKGWFDGEAPPFLVGAIPAEPAARRQLMMKVMLLASVIADLVVDMAALPNLMARANGETQEQIRAARAATT